MSGVATDEKSVRVESLAPSELGLDAGVFARFAAGIGSFAVVDLETTGLGADAELLEVGALLVDPGEQSVQTLSVLLRPERPIPRMIERLTGISQALADGGAVLAEVAPSIAEHLAGRTLLAHNADFERSFLSRCIDPALGDAVYLDTLDLLSVTYPDASDLRLETFTRLLLGHEESHRGLDDALDTARVMSAAGVGAAAGEARYVVAARALEAFAPESPWLALLGKEVFPAPLPETSGYVEIGATDESPTPFDFDAIEAVLRDEARGRRHFRGYRVREEQIRLARAFARNLADDEILLLEGGTGIGKSLAYLAAAIPFAVERAEAGEKSPVLISTRTRLLQDQLLGKDIGAAARFLGYPDLRALSIKGRANYACARRLAVALSRGREPSVFPEQRLAYSVLEACARTRRNGEIGTVPAALLRRFPPLREMLRRSVAARSEQCTREQCASERWCPLGRQRSALAGAHLVVANHDLMLRWPVDYPAFDHVIADEVHELGGVADEAYSLEVRPDEVLERFDELFGRPRGGRRPKRGEALVPQPGAGARRDVVAWRRELAQDLSALARALQDEAGDFGDVQIPESPGPEYSAARQLAESAAERMDHLADHAEEEGESGAILDRAVADLRGWAEALRLALAGERPDAVASFEGVEAPYDRWRMVVRLVSPADAFHKGLMERVRSFAGVSASLFVEGNAFAALGDLDLETRAGDRLYREAVPSPFPYETHMRVLVLEGPVDLVTDTANVLEDLARRLGGRTLGLFTSLRRMLEVAEELAPRLRADGIDVLTPRRASDDPSALVERFQNGNAVLLGARKFWQGLDLPGEMLQAVVIEKLPFEVPTELRGRRDLLLRDRGIAPFSRYTLGRMLLNLKQMSGRLIRTEEDRGVVVIVEGRTDKGYFRRLSEAFPKGAVLRVGTREQLPELLDELKLGAPRS